MFILLYILENSFSGFVFLQKFKQLGLELLNYRYLVHSHNYAFKLYILDLLVPLVIANFINLRSDLWISIEDLFNQVFDLCGYKSREQVITAQDLLVKFSSIRVFKRQIPTCHSV